MRIALYNLEPKIVNTAMMQVSQYHKQRGNEVEIYNPLFHDSYDKIYAFSIFDFTDKGYVTEDMVCGGTGFSISAKLPRGIEKCDFDYSIFPNCKTSYVWFSRGCIRKCPFCVVWKKEGSIHPVKPKPLNPDGEYITVMDNNFFASPKWREAIAQLKEWNQPVNFSSGIDVRLFSEEQGKALQGLRLYKQIHIAWDNPRENLVPKVRELTEYIRPRNIMCYVLIGYWSTPEQDLYRVEQLRKLKVDPFVMPYNKQDRYQKDFARWVNHKAIWKSVGWGDYRGAKGPLYSVKALPGDL